MNLCRMCGEEKSPLDFNIELNDKTDSNWTYRELIEHHTRVFLNTSKLLPQSVCEDCRATVEGFAEFSSKLQAVQNTFNVEGAEDDHMKDGFVQLQPMAELFPETVIKEQIESNEDTDDTEGSCERKKVRPWKVKCSSINSFHF